MSNKLLTAVFNANIYPAAAKLVALALADHCDDDGKTWQAKSTLANKASLDERTVGRAVSKLQSLGVLTVQLGRGWKGVNVYVLSVPRLAELSWVTIPGEMPSPAIRPPGNTPPIPRHNAEGGEGNTSQTPRRNAPQTLLEPKVEPTLNPQSLCESSFPSLDESKGERSKPDYRGQAKEVLKLLNTSTGREFRATEPNLKMIMARLKEPEVTFDGVTRMVRRQVNVWMSTDMEPYLRPSTLFSASKFDSYYANRDVQSVNSRPSRHNDFDGRANRNADIADLERWRADYHKTAAEAAKAGDNGPDFGP